MKVQSLLSLSTINVKLGQRELLRAISFGVTKTSRIGLVGANGCGKSTLLKVIMGEIEPDSGEIIKPKHVQIGYVQQFVASKEAKLSLYEYLSERAERGQRVPEWEAIANALELGLSEEQLGQPLDSLSGGQLNIALLAGALALGPDLLLMDEPTNGLDTEGIAAFELAVSCSLKVPFILVSHDRAMLDTLTNETVILQDGQAFQFKLSFSNALDQFAALAEERLKQRLQEERELEKLRDTAAVLQVWAGRNGKRFSGRYHSQLKRVERAEQNMTETFSDDNRILALGNQQILSDYALKIEGVDVAVPGRHLFHVDEILIKPGEKVFIAGANGVGKTTLLRRIEECFLAQAGMSFSPALSLGVYQQNLQYFANEETALEYLGKRIDKPTSQLRGCLVKAGFEALRHNQPISQMSGGERARIKFLELRLRAPSLLLLDEPTNHLDIQGIAQLEEEIEESQSTFVLVSHDRRFLAAVAKRVFVVSNNRIQEVMHIDEYLAKVG